MYWKKIYIQDVPFLLAALVCLIIAVTFIIFGISTLEINPFLVDWGFIFFNVACYLIGWHYESLLSPKPLISKRNSYTAVAIILSSLLYFFNTLGLPQFMEISFNYIFTTVYASFAFGFAMWVVIQAFRVTKARSSVIEFFALFLVFIALLMYTGFLLNYLFFNQVPDLSIFLIIAAILGVAGFGAIIMDFFVYRHTFRLPHPVYYLLIYSKDGIPVYFQKVHDNKAMIVDDAELIPALFSAIEAFTQETLGHHEEIATIEGNTFQILFSHFGGEKLIFSVITARGSFYLNRAIKRFIQSIPDDLVQQLNLHIPHGECLSFFHAMLRKSFPFLDFQESPALIS